MTRLFKWGFLTCLSPRTLHYIAFNLIGLNKHPCLLLECCILLLPDNVILSNQIKPRLTAIHDVAAMNTTFSLSIHWSEWLHNYVTVLPCQYHNSDHLHSVIQIRCIQRLQYITIKSLMLHGYIKIYRTSQQITTTQFPGKQGQSQFVYVILISSVRKQTGIVEINGIVQANQTLVNALVSNLSPS